MPVGLIVLLAVAALVYFGLAQRVLDRMRLTDKQALLFIGLMLLGSLIDIPILRNSVDLSINVGGAVVPLALAIFLLARADEPREKVRALLAALVTAGFLWGISQLTDFEPPERDFIDPIWLFSIVAGLVGYLAGRSRRAAFIAGTMGILLLDVISLARNLARRLPATMAIGGAGVFDSIVLAGVIAVGLAELVGETRERLGGGPAGEMARPRDGAADEEFSAELTDAGEKGGGQGEG
ncbi:MAG: DUF1614 domain-containing protein [Firmicutes bacterium]|jgi:uncharacterized membrane protein|nr:DUF1614 domain-containing protein [Bacillota bacterium]